MVETEKDRIAELKLALVHARARISICAGIGKPYKSNRGNGFLCDVFLEGLESNSLFMSVAGGNALEQNPTFSIAGQDSIQALGLAMELLRSNLKNISEMPEWKLEIDDSQIDNQSQQDPTFNVDYYFGNRTFRDRL